MAVNHCWCIQLSQRANAPICLRLNNLTRQVKLVNSEKCIRLCRECDWTYLRLPDRDFDLDLDFDERDECRLGLRRGDTDRRGELHINHMYILYTLRAKNATVFSYNSHTHTHPFNGALSGTTRLSRYQKGKTNPDFTE